MHVALSPAVSLAGGQAGSCLCHRICNVLRQRLCGVTNAQADDLSIRVLLLMSAATPGNLLHLRTENRSVAAAKKVHGDTAAAVGGLHGWGLLA
jgi:hypothetical protein